MYTVENFYVDILRLYENVNTVPFKRTTLPKQLERFGHIVETVFEQKFIDYVEVVPQRYGMTKNVKVAFSGGKDSAALALLLKQKGYNVTLVHMTGLNKAYPDERKYVENFASLYSMPVIYIKPETVVQKGSYVENLAKNFMLLATCLRQSMFASYNAGLGCATSADEMLKDYGFSDSATPLKQFAEGVEELFGLEVIIGEVASEGQAYTILVDNEVNFENIISCMMPIRYRGNLRKKNIEKGLIIRPNGCGQCYKCAYDYFYLSALGVLDSDDKSDEHYLEQLMKHWSHYTNKEPHSRSEAFILAFYGECEEHLVERLSKRLFNIT